MLIMVMTTDGRRYVQLAESYRNDAGQSRQRVLATLGGSNQAAMSTA